MTKLAHLSESKLDHLRNQIPENIDRYSDSGFEDLAKEPGWSLELGEDFDLTGLDKLDGSEASAEMDLHNTILVSQILGNLSPSLANEERIWVRLSHVEAFEYSRDRWIKTKKDSDSLESLIETHFFARTQTGLRDDHAISRLWWNGYIARHCYPQNAERGMELLLSTADVRSNLVERIWLIGRRKLASGVFRCMERDSSLLSSEKSFREFMKSLNFLGGGVVFETMTDDEIDRFLDRCSEFAAEVVQKG